MSSQGAYEIEAMVKPSSIGTPYLARVRVRVRVRVRIRVGVRVRDKG